MSTLRRYLEAAGGRLRILAEFPDAEPIEIAGFSEVDPVNREEALLRPRSSGNKLRGLWDEERDRHA